MTDIRPLRCRQVNNTECLGMLVVPMYSWRESQSGCWQTLICPDCGTVAGDIETISVEDLLDVRPELEDKLNA